VLSISGSGHKYGQSMCGIGWLVFRKYEELAQHVSTRTTYLGGEDLSLTLNFSRPAAALYVQMYKFARMGYIGYTRLATSMCATAEEISASLGAMAKDGVPRFIVLSRDTALPVACALFNPECGMNYNAVVLQNKILADGWFVSGYTTAMYRAVDGQTVPLFADVSATSSMFRIVVKANMSPSMAKQLLYAVSHALEWLDHNYSVSEAREATSPGFRRRLGPQELARGLC